MFIQVPDNFNNTLEYLPILNGSLLADLIIISIVFFTPYFQSNMLKTWYKNYRLSAVIADTLILVIGIIITRWIYYKFEIKRRLVKANMNTEFVNLIIFLTILVGVQILHDYLFYLAFTNIKTGTNKMLDLFKHYAKEVSYKAILGDSFMIIIAGILSSIFNKWGYNSNIIVFVVLTYLTPYIIWAK